MAEHHFLTAGLKRQAIRLISSCCKTDLFCYKYFLLITHLRRVEIAHWLDLALGNWQLAIGNCDHWLNPTTQVYNLIVRSHLGLCAAEIISATVSKPSRPLRLVPRFPFPKATHFPQSPHHRQLLPVPSVVRALEAAAHGPATIRSLGCQMNGAALVLPVDTVHRLHQPA